MKEGLSGTELTGR